MYYLMNKDQRLASFDLEEDSISNVKLLSEHLPYGFADDPTGFIKNRMASSHSSHLRRLMVRLGCNQLKSFLKTTHALGLNDTIWITSDTEALKWRKVSLYQNPFHDGIEQLAFEGYDFPENLTASASPSLTTDGSFCKCFRHEDDKIYLYKRGSDIGYNSGKESYSEILASEIVHIISPSSVTYDFKTLYGQPASSCKLFTSEDFGFVPVRMIQTKEKKLSTEDLFLYFSSIGSENTFREMMVADALILNEDRHLGNFGVLIDNNTFEPVKMAPLFDYNIAMGTYLLDHELLDNQHIDERMPRLGDDFFAEAAKYITPEIRARVEELQAYRFQFRGDETFTEERIEALEKIVHASAEAILSGKTSIYTAFPSEKVMKKQKELNETLEKKKKLTPEANLIYASLEKEGFFASLVEDSQLLRVECELDFGDLIRSYDFMSGTTQNTDATGKQMSYIPEKYEKHIKKMDEIVLKHDMHRIFKQLERP